MTNSLGQRVLAMYASGAATRAQLDAAHTRGWVSDEDHAAAVAEPDPPADPAPGA